MINVYWQRSILNCVPYVPTCHACLHAHVPTFFACFPGHVPYVLTCQRFWRAYLLTCLACLSAMTSNNESKFTLRIQ